MIDEDTCISLVKIASALNISSGSASSILRNRLDYHKVCMRWIPHILTLQQKRERVTCSAALLQMYDICDPRRHGELVTGDETWPYYFELVKKAMNGAWVLKVGHAPQIARRCRSEKKVLYTIFFHSKGVLSRKPSKAGKSIMGVYYRDCSFRIEQILWKKTPDQPTRGTCGMKLVHDNAAAHKWKLIQEYLTKGNIPAIPRPPYSPTLVPRDSLVSMSKGEPLRMQIQLPFSPQIRCSSGCLLAGCSLCRAGTG